MKRLELWFILVSMGFVQVFAQTFALQVKEGELAYLMDQKGNRILDYSSCGYRNSDEEIPHIANTIFVPWKEGDNTARIQRAIDYVSSLPLGKDGFRGAVLVDKGTFRVKEGLRIHASGVVVRGMDKSQTVLLKEGTDRGALLYVEGRNDRVITDTLEIGSAYVPVNTCTFQVSGSVQLKKGDRICVVRPSSKEWIASLGCDQFGGDIKALGWKPGEIDLAWDRTLTDVTANQITVNAPFTVALDATWGTTRVVRYQWKGRIADSGVENMSLVSDYDQRYPKDEEHCWTGISIANAENCWVRQVNFSHFSGSAVIVQPTASKVTVEDCIAKEPISELAGMRRYTFYTLGQQTLFQRCYSEEGIHDYVAGYCAAGPNAFVQCEAKEARGFSGSVGSWACGLLFDIVDIDGHNLTFKNLGQDKNGAGWNTANSLFWQCTAAEIECYSPATDAVNRAYGCWAQFSGDGEWGESNNHVKPRSLFYAQLSRRLKRDCSLQARIMPLKTNTTSSPTVEEAKQMAEEALYPRLQLLNWIEKASCPAAVSVGTLKTVDELRVKKVDSTKLESVFEIRNGRLAMEGHLLVGSKYEVPWWSGNLRTSHLSKAKFHITRFVPGREGEGLTDHIDSVVNKMVEKQLLALDHNYGLWYERRRDDHERMRRRDADVWGPFYEQPFARSGEGKAWDGLSKYDLNRPNAWYWERLKAFADKGSKKGLLLFHEHFFQHSILEAGAHWVDNPWRTANNINGMDFPEPINFTGDKRLFMADRFYDCNHPVRRTFYKQYIRWGLDHFADHPNVIQFVSAEYTGPLHFMQFWLDVVAEWEKETGKKAQIALSATKDVQDAILNDPERAKYVDLIDIRFWHYNTDGLYAPKGGANLAPRQYARKMKVGTITYMEAYKAVSEYRKKYPEKAVIYYAQNYAEVAWGVFMAGGSCPAIPIKNKAFLKDAISMDREETGTDSYQKMVKSGIGSIIYSHIQQEIPVKLPSGRYSLWSINPETGEVTEIDKSLIVRDVYILKTLKGKSCIYWFRKK